MAKKYHNYEITKEDRSKIKRMEDCLLEAGKFLDKLKVPFTLGSGTLLGIYRDKQLIPWDNDVDFHVHRSDLTEEIVEELHGKALGVKLTSNELELLFRHKGVHADIFVIDFAGSYAFIKYKRGYRSIWPDYHYRKENWEEIEFLGRKWNIPGSVEAYLACFFGKDWETPVVWQNPDKKRRKLMWDDLK